MEILFQVFLDWLGLANNRVKEDIFGQQQAVKLSLKEMRGFPSPLFPGFKACTTTLDGITKTFYSFTKLIFRFSENKEEFAENFSIGKVNRL